MVPQGKFFCSVMVLFYIIKFVYYGNKNISISGYPNFFTRCYNDSDF